MKSSKRFFIMILSVVAFVLVGAFSGCNDTPKTLGDYWQWIVQSETTVQTVQMDITVQDSGVTVYGYEKTVAFGKDGSASVTVAETKLNGSFALETKETTETVAETDRSALLDLSLEEDDVKEYSYSGGTLTAVISKEKIGEVLGWTSIRTETDVTLTFGFDDKKLVKADGAFRTTTGRDVTLNVVYAY